MSEKTTGSRSASRFVRSASAKPAPSDTSARPVKSGRPVAVSNRPAVSSTGDRSSRTAGNPAIRALATWRGISHAASTNTMPAATWSNSLIQCPAWPDVKAEAPQDRVADDGRRDVAKLQAEHQRPGKRDSASAAVDAALDDAGRGLAAGEKRGRPVEAIGHRRIEKTRTYDRHPNPTGRQARSQRFGIGTQPGFARAVAGAVGKPPVGGDRRHDRHLPSATRAKGRQQRLDCIDRP